MLPALPELLLTLIRILALVLIFYFLASILYLVNRTRRVPSLQAVLRVMSTGIRGFPGIARHRVKLAPMRIREVLHNRGRRHVVHPAYPHSNKPTSSARTKKKK